MTRRVLITGCSTGIGRGATTRFLERGWQVIATMRRLEERRPEFAPELDRYGDKLQLLELDVTREADRAAAVEACEGGLDALVNNAGYGLFGALVDVSEAQLRAQFEVNVFGAALLTRALIPQLIPRRGAVILLSSMLGTMAPPLTTGYCASKFAVEGLGESLYYELHPHGVRVHLIEPGGFRTRFADNVAWGEGADPTFAGQTRSYKALVTKLSTGGPGKPPEAVIRKVLRLCERRSSKLRVTVGSDAWVSTALKALTPQLIDLGASRMLFRRIFSKEG